MQMRYSFPTKQMSQRRRLIGRPRRRQATQAEPKDPRRKKHSLFGFPAKFHYAGEQVNFSLVDQQHEARGAASVCSVRRSL